MMRRVRRAAAMVLVMVMAASPVMAGDLSKSVKTAVEREMAQSRPAARGENPYKIAAIGLMGGGATLTILAFTNPTGVECSDKGGLTSYSVECGTKANKGLLFSGIGAIGLGAFLFWKGERERSPEIVVHGGRLFIRERISW